MEDVRKLHSITLPWKLYSISSLRFCSRKRKPESFWTAPSSPERCLCASTAAISYLPLFSYFVFFDRIIMTISPKPILDKYPSYKLNYPCINFCFSNLIVEKCCYIFWRFTPKKLFTENLKNTLHYLFIAIDKLNFTTTD